MGESGAGGGAVGGAQGGQPALLDRDGTGARRPAAQDHDRAILPPEALPHGAVAVVWVGRVLLQDTAQRGELPVGQRPVRRGGPGAQGAWCTSVPLPVSVDDNPLKDRAPTLSELTARRRGDTFISAGPTAVRSGSEPQEFLPDDRAWGSRLVRVATHR